MAQAQLGLGGGQAGQALHQGVEVQTDAWGAGRRAETFEIASDAETAESLRRISEAAQIFSINPQKSFRITFSSLQAQIRLN